MRHKLNTFILKNPPDDKISKAEKRCTPVWQQYIRPPARVAVPVFGFASRRDTFVRMSPSLTGDRWHWKQGYEPLDRLLFGFISRLC